MGKSRDLFKKIRDTKGTFHAKMGTIKDRNGIDLMEAEDIKKRWKEYTLLNSEYQRIARREKKAFLHEQCKELEENNRMGTTRNFFKKIRNNKETFHTKMGTIMGIHGIDLTEAEDIKKRWQEYIKELHKIIIKT